MAVYKISGGSLDYYMNFIKMFIGRFNSISSFNNGFEICFDEYTCENLGNKLEQAKKNGNITDFEFIRNETQNCESEMNAIFKDCINMNSKL